MSRALPAGFAADLARVGSATRRWNATCGFVLVACSTRPTVVLDRTDAGETSDAAAVDAASVPTFVDAATPSAVPPDGGDANCTSGCLSRELPNWPMPNAKNLPLPNPARLTVKDGIWGDSVLDEVTGLTWSVAFSERVSFEGAEEYCGALRGASVMAENAMDGGATGADMAWRVPTRIELITLLDRTQFPTIDRGAFPDTPEDYFWSASRVPSEPDASEDVASRYSVYFGVGETAWGAEDQVAAHTRCVRAGFRRPAPQYDVNDVVVRDRATGLVWQRHAPTVALGIEAARTYCAELSDEGLAGAGLTRGTERTDGTELADGKSWRVPSGKELQTLIQPMREPGVPTLLDVTAFPDAEPVTVWGDEGTQVQPMFLRVATGFAGVAETGASHHVRCVR